MPLKSFQGLSVSASTCLQRQKGTKSTLRQFNCGRWGQLSNTEIGEMISDGVQSQATTSWFYSQGTTADHMYVKYTWVSNKICTVVLLMQNTFKLQTTSDAQNILKNLWKHLSQSTWQKADFHLLKPCYGVVFTNLKKNCCIHTTVWIWVESLSTF